MEDITHPWSQGQEVAGLGLRPVLPSEPWKAAPSEGGLGPGAGRGLSGAEPVGGGAGESGGCSGAGGRPGR